MKNFSWDNPVIDLEGLFMHWEMEGENRNTYCNLFFPVGQEFGYHLGRCLGFQVSAIETSKRQRFLSEPRIIRSIYNEY